jgi:hypothetical protein
MSVVVTKYYIRNEKNNKKPVVKIKSCKFDTEDSSKPIRYAAQKAELLPLCPPNLKMR